MRQRDGQTVSTPSERIPNSVQDASDSTRRVGGLNRPIQGGSRVKPIAKTPSPELMYHEIVKTHETSSGDFCL